MRAWVPASTFSLKWEGQALSRASRGGVGSLGREEEERLALPRV